MRLIFTFFLVSLSFLAISQSQALINYQGVARDASGNPVINQPISLKFEILQGSPSGSVVCTDNQMTGISTNNLGLFTTQIGKNTNLNLVNWQNGPFYLKVSIDITGNSNPIPVGTQEIVTVPLAMHVPSSLNGNLLTIGSKTHSLDAGATIAQGTGTNVIVSGGPNYTISSVLPSLALTSNNASISIVGSNTIALPAAITPTMYPSGIASVTNGAYAYTVGVLAPTYNSNTSVLSFGSNTTLITPTLGILNNSILYSGPPTNSIALPAAITVTPNSTNVTVTGGPNYSIAVAPPSLAMSANNLSISIVGSNSVALPAAVTVTATAPAANNLVTVSGGPVNYSVGLAYPSYNGTVLTLGASNTTIAPSLSINGSTLSSGIPSNSVNLGTIGVWRQATGSVTLATATDNVAIGTPGLPTSKLEVYSSTSTVPVTKITNQNALNNTAALDVASNGALSFRSTNTNATGLAGDFSSTVGSAISAVNNSSVNAAILVNNTDPSAASVGGYIGGGLVTQGKSLSTAFSFCARNFASANLFVVRNDGNVGIGTSTPLLGMLNIDVQLQNKHAIYIQNSRDIVGGSMPLQLEMSTASQTYNSFTSGSTWGRFFRATNVDITNATYDFGINNFGSLFFAHVNDYAPAALVITTANNIGLGVNTPTAKLEVNGNVKITDGTEGVGKVLTSDASGSASWQPLTITTTTTFGNQNIAALTTVASNFPSSLASFSKVNNDTKIQVIFQTHIYVSDLVGTNAVTYELKLGSTAASGNSGKVCYFVDNNLALNIANYKSVTIIAEFTGALPAGAYTVDMTAYANAIGTAVSAYIDPGNFGTNSLIIKEYR